MKKEGRKPGKNFENAIKKFHLRTKTMSTFLELKKITQRHEKQHPIITGN
jgi:hypothetical protein